MIPIIVNNLILWKEDRQVFRVLWIDNNSTDAFIIDINDVKSHPLYIQINNLVNDINDNKAELLNHDPWAILFLDGDIKAKHKEIRDKAWEIIDFLLSSCEEPHIYDRQIRNKCIREASTKFSITTKSIDKYLLRYWKRGMTKNSLLPDYFNCGLRGLEKNYGDKKIGRPAKNNSNKGINVDGRIKDIFNKAINKYYLTTNQNTFKSAYELMIKDYFSEEFRFENGVKKPIILDEIPTLNQFRYWYSKEKNIQKEVSTRKSAKRYYLENRPILGESTSQALGPGSIFQIDATIADVYLVSRYNKSHIIGRPVVYAVIDVFSRMITGVYIGLEGPSYIGAMTALSNAAMDKVKFCNEYNISISESEWPTKFIPEAILADRGELEGKSIENIIEGLSITVSVCTSYRGDLKAIVERYFRTINEQVKPFIPGAINGDFRQRGGKDYRLDAKLNIFQFTQLIIKCILFHNNHHYLKDYKRDEMMIEDEVKPIPINIWNWGIKNRAGKLRSVDEDLVKFYLLPRDKARVTGRGISFKGILYSNEKALKDRRFEKARNNGSWSVQISYDPRIIDYIYIIDEDGKNFEKCFLLNHEDRYIGKTLEEIEYLMEYEKIKKKENEKDELQSKIDLIADIESIVNSAKREENVDDNNISKTKRLKGINENRSREKMINRESEFLELKRQEVKDSKIIFMNPADEGFELNDESDLIKKVQKKRFKDE